MDKEWWKAFFRWLEQAIPEELQRRKAELLEFARKKLDDPDVKADAKRMVRLIDQELLAHASVSRRSKGMR
jgi:hypothetical protein